MCIAASAIRHVVHQHSTQCGIETHVASCSDLQDTVSVHIQPDSEVYKIYFQQMLIECEHTLPQYF